MKKLYIILLIVLSSCSTKPTNILNINVDNNIYEEISKDTIELINNNIDFNSSNIIIYSKQNNFTNIIEETLKKAGYATIVSNKNMKLNKDDYILNYILDTMDKTKLENSTVLTVRYTLSINKKECSKIYKISNNNEVFFKSEWYCLGE